MPPAPAAPENQRQVIPVPFRSDDLASILLYAIDLGASDIHLSVGEPPLFRIHGSIMSTDLPALPSAALHRMLYDLLDDEQRKRLERDQELDFAMQFGMAARFRVNCFYTIAGEGAAFRIIPTKIRTLDELGMPPILKRISERPRGLVLVTGPTGSGKSTTLAAMIDYINVKREEHIITIEDPVEFVHSNKTCIINQRQVGQNTKSFAAALRSALREDPDVVLVGEMRDLETISLALTAAETGHLVFGTLHTQSAVKTCDRVIDVFPPEQQQLVRVMFAESYQAIICQALVPKITGDGRVCAMEIMVGTAATRALIREGKTHQLLSIIQTSAKYGMQSLDQHLKFLLERGVISERDALMKSNNPDYILEGGQEKLDQMSTQASTRIQVQVPRSAAGAHGAAAATPVAQPRQPTGQGSAGGAAPSPAPAPPAWPSPAAAQPAWPQPQKSSPRSGGASRTPGM